MHRNRKNIRLKGYDYSSKGLYFITICTKNRHHYFGEIDNQFGKTIPGSISAIIGQFKSSVTRWCNKNDLNFAWQSRFHDHIIRNEPEYNRIEQYIINNVANWNEDKFYK